MFKIITNFNYYNPDISISSWDLNFPNNIAMQKLIFCSNDTLCAALTNRYYLTNVFWGAAFYKNMRLNEGNNWNFFSSTEYISGA